MFRLFAGYFYFYPFKNNVKRVILYYGFLYTAVPENIKKQITRKNHAWKF